MTKDARERVLGRIVVDLGSAERNAAFLREAERQLVDDDDDDDCLRCGANHPAGITCEENGIDAVAYLEEEDFS